MRIVLDRLAVVHLGLMVVLYVAVIALVFMQVVYRYVLRFGLTWSADLAVAAFTWLVFLATAYGIRQGFHFTMDVLPTRLPKAVQIATRGLSSLAVLIVLLILVYYGYLFTISSLPARMPALGVSRAWVVGAIPISGVLALVYWVAGVRASVLGGRAEGQA
jgi:TRAP-type transport system small permease protein